MDTVDCIGRNVNRTLETECHICSINIIIDCLWNTDKANAAFVQEHYDALTLGNESFSIELWFKSAGGSVDWYLLHKGSHATNSYEGATGKWFGIQYQKNSKNDRLTWAVDDDVTKTDINVTGATTKYFNNEWVHLVCVRDVEEKQLKMYANGILVASGADKTGDIGTIERMAIGNCNTAYENGFQGLMDELKLYMLDITMAPFADCSTEEDYQSKTKK